MDPNPRNPYAAGTDGPPVQRDFADEGPSSKASDKFNPVEKENVEFNFLNPDLNHLAKKACKNTPLKPKTLGFAVKQFGEDLVVEALRRLDGQPIYSARYFFGALRNVERET